MNLIGTNQLDDLSPSNRAYRTAFLVGILTKEPSTEQWPGLVTFIRKDFLILMGPPIIRQRVIGNCPIELLAKMLDGEDGFIAYTLAYADNNGIHVENFAIALMELCFDFMVTIWRKTREDTSWKDSTETYVTLIKESCRRNFRYGKLPRPFWNKILAWKDDCLNVEYRYIHNAQDSR